MLKQGQIQIKFSVCMFMCKIINQINSRRSSVVNHLNDFVLNISVDIRFTCFSFFIIKNVQISFEINKRDLKRKLIGLLLKSNLCLGEYMY